MKKEKRAVGGITLHRESNVNSNYQCYCLCYGDVEKMDVSEFHSDNIKDLIELENNLQNDNK